MFEIKKVTVANNDNSALILSNVDKSKVEYHKPCDPEEGNCSPTATCSPATP